MTLLETENQLGVCQCFVGDTNMDTNKVRQLIADLEEDIRAKSNAISALRTLLNESVTSSDTDRPTQQPIPILGAASYMELAVRALEQANGTLHMKRIVEYIRQAKGNPNIERRSVEATLIQHLKAKGESSRVVKVRPGVWGLRRFPRSEPAA